MAFNLTLVTPHFRQSSVESLIHFRSARLWRRTRRIASPKRPVLVLYEAGGLAARAAVTVDEPKLGLAHFPALLHDLEEQPVPHDLGRAITVEVDAHLRCLRDEGSG